MKGSEEVLLGLVVLALRADPLGEGPSSDGPTPGDRAPKSRNWGRAGGWGAQAGWGTAYITNSNCNSSNGYPVFQAYPMGIVSQPPQQSVKHDYYPFAKKDIETENLSDLPNLSTQRVKLGLESKS